MSKYLVAAATALALGASAAGAVTVTSGPASTSTALGGGAQTLTVTPTTGASFSEFYLAADGADTNAVSFTIEASNNLSVTGISLSASGAFADIDLLSFTMSATSGTYEFDLVDNPGTADTGNYGFAGFDLLEGETVSIVFNTSTALSDNVGLSATIFTAPIPLPAALPLMIGGLGGLVALRRQRKA